MTEWSDIPPLQGLLNQDVVRVNNTEGPLVGGNSVFSPYVRPDDTLDKALRPLGFDQFIGQEKLVRNIAVFIKAALARQEALDHVLLYGPPGLGKTTLAMLIARAMGRAWKTSSGPVLSKTGDLVALLTQLQPHDVLFIDEIHRLPLPVEEVLYSAMEDYRVDIILGDGPHARSLTLDIPPFTLVGATTRVGLLSAPLRDRFGISLPLEFYDVSALAAMMTQAAVKLEMVLGEGVPHLIGQRSRGTPRIALRLLKRLRDFMHTQSDTVLQEHHVLPAMELLGVNAWGLDTWDQKYLHVLADFFRGGPAGLETMSAALSEAKDTLEEVIEPYLLQSGLIQRTSRGRKLTDLGWQILGRPIPDSLLTKDNDTAQT